MADTATPFPLSVGARAMLSRHADWWRRQATLCAAVEQVPLGSLWLPLAGGTVATEDVDLTPDMLDLDRLAGPALEPGPLEFAGDLIRTAVPYSRVPWVEAILGAGIRATLQGGSMRTRAPIRSWREWNERADGPENGWLAALVRLTELLVRDCAHPHARAV
jgi:hypothetical protein